MRFLDYLRKVRLYSESTINHYKTAIERWDKYLADKDEISDARDFVINLHEQGLNPATVNHIVSCLRAYCNYLVIFEGAASNPFFGIKSARTRKRLPMFVTEDNICSIMARMPRGDWYQDMSYICVYTLFWTGLRVSELSNLRRDDITREYIKVHEGKGCKDRIVPMPDDVSDTIHDYMMRTSGTYLLEYQPNKPICTRSIRRIIDAALSDLPRQMRHPHMLRHSFATAMLNRGINIKSIATILGHASITTTEIYTHCDWQSLRDEYQMAYNKH